MSYFPTFYWVTPGTCPWFLELTWALDYFLCSYFSLESIFLFNFELCFHHLQSCHYSNCFSQCYWYQKSWLKTQSKQELYWYNFAMLTYWIFLCVVSPLFDSFYLNCSHFLYLFIMTAYISLVMALNLCPTSYFQFLFTCTCFLTIAIFLFSYYFIYSFRLSLLISSLGFIKMRCCSKNLSYFQRSHLTIWFSIIVTSAYGLFYLKGIFPVSKIC